MTKHGISFRFAVQCIFGTIILMTLYYVFFTLFFSTDAQKRLQAENELYEELLPALENDVDMLGEELEYLESVDGAIYSGLFKTGVPSPDAFLHGRAAVPDDAMASAARTEDNWRAIFDMLYTEGRTLPPLYTPLEGLEYTSVGASTGDKMNPFYKMNLPHEGVDLFAPQGSDVRSTAGGTVTKVKSNVGGKGLVVEISHPDGYVTRYACLDKALVKKGDRVRTGQKIGLVGDSGRSFTTHLHYEMEKDGAVVDPVYWFLDSGDPSEYYRMLVMSVVSGQSLD